MILYFDSFISDIPLIKNFVKANDRIRTSCKNYEMPRKVDIAKYTLASYALYQWSHILIRYELDDPQEYKSFDEYILKLFPKAVIMHERSDSQSDFRKSIEIMDTWDDNWIFYAGNNDHTLILTDISIPDRLIEKAKSFSTKYPFISIVYSHFSEFINLPKKGSPFNLLYGQDSKIIEESDLATVIVRGNGDNSAIQIVNKNLFKEWFDNHDLGNARVIRSENVREHFLIKDQLMIIPKQEICAHFDGYSHTIGSKSEITADEVPPLIIPPGFFKNNIKIAYGYDTYRENWTNINPTAQYYSFRDIKHGTDLMITIDQIPLFWKNHIAKIDRNPSRNDNYLKKMYDKKQAIVTNPWAPGWSQIKKEFGYFLKKTLSAPKRAFKKAIKIYKST